MTPNPFVTAGRVARAVKSAALPGAIDPAGYQNYLADKGGRTIANIGLAALGAGAAARGGVGLINLIRRSVNPPTAKYPSALITKVPFPVDGEVAPADDEETDKLAAADAVTDYSNFNWFLPGAMAAAGLGAYGGWKGVDAVLDSRREADLDDETRNAKTEFEKAILGSYPRTRTSITAKLASAPREKSAGEQLGEMLDRIYDAFVEKAASGGSPLNPLNWLSADTRGALGGAYATYALGSGLGAGVLAYNRASKGTQRSVLENAMKQRLRRAYMQRPSEVLAVPTPVSVPPSSVRPKLDETDDIDRAADETPEESAEPFAPRKRRVDFLGVPQ